MKYCSQGINVPGNMSDFMEARHCSASFPKSVVKETSSFYETHVAEKTSHLAAGKGIGVGSAVKGIESEVTRLATRALCTCICILVRHRTR